MAQKKTHIMGILNVTPDSFSDGGKYESLETALNHAAAMIGHGVDSIDIGGESTRPGSESISSESELQRVIPVIKEIKKKYSEQVTLSIDSYKGSVVKEALAAGATIVNSLGGFTLDSTLIDIVKHSPCKIVLYHIKGNPKTMQSGEITYKNVIEEITEFFNQQISLAEQQGISRERIILDPGIGFGKNLQQNLKIIRNIDKLAAIGLPVMIGVSRKSHLGMLLKEELELDTIPDTAHRLEASLAETAVAVMKGATYVRTHDIPETKRFLTILDNLK